MGRKTDSFAALRKDNSLFWSTTLSGNVLVFAAAGLVVMLGALGARAQRGDRLGVVLERAAAASDAQKQSLPNFECREDVVSQELHKGKVEEEGRMAAMLRVHREPTTGRLDESYAPLGNPGARGALPYYVVGGFGLAMDYVSREHQACYSYTLQGDRLEFQAKPHREVAALGCTNPDEITGWAQVDADGDIVHIERTVPLKQAYRTGFVPWAGIDLGLVTLDGKAFRMSTHVVAVSGNGRESGRFEATYSGCRLFGATVTIREGGVVDAPVPENRPQ